MSAKTPAAAVQSAAAMIYFFKMTTKTRVRYDGASPVPIICYLVSVCAALMYTLCRSQFLPCALIMAALTAGIFMLFYCLRKKPMWVTACVLLLIVGSWVSGTIAGRHENADGGFMNFLFTASANFDIVFAAASIFMFSSIIGFIGFYFSVDSPRPCFLLLLSFIPLILSSRTMRELPVYFMLIMTGCFIFASANLSVPCFPGVKNFEGKHTRLRRAMLSCAASLLMTLAAAVLPKSTETPLEDYLNKMVPQTGGYNINAGLSQNFAIRSSVNTGNNQQPDKILFSVVTEKPQLLKRWVFDQYDEDGWTALDDFNNGEAGWENNADLCNAQRLLEDMVYYPDMVDENYSYLTDGLPDSDLENYKMIIYLRGEVQTYVILHPETTYMMSIPDECGRSYMTPRGDCFSEKPMPDGTSYVLRCTNPAPNAEFLRRMDKNTFLGLLDSSLTTYRSSALRAQYMDAQTYRKTVGDTGITPEIQALADEITAGLTNDFDKAEALEKWFGDDGFVYDLSYAPAEHTPNYFLLESKRGICSDYASALTLLARAAGLPARYCEGFAMPQSAYNEITGAYDITGSQAHAWTEVYIPGGGWIALDGTRCAALAEDGGKMPDWVFAAAIAAAFILAVFLLRKPLAWAGFNLFYPLRSTESKVRGVYVYTRRLAAGLSGADEECMSAGEVRRLLTDRLGMPQESGAICSAADALMYSGGNISEVDPKSLLKYLKALRRRRRRLGK